MFVKKKERVPHKLEETKVLPTTISVPPGQKGDRGDRTMSLHTDLDLVSEHKGSLSQILNLKVLVLSLIAASGIIGIVIIGLVSSLRQVHSKLDRTNELAVERVELFFTDVESSVRTGRHILQNQDKTRLFLLSILSNHPYISGAQLIDREGNILNSQTSFGHSQDNDVQEEKFMDWGSQLEQLENYRFLIVTKDNYISQN